MHPSRSRVPSILAVFALIATGFAFLLAAPTPALAAGSADIKINEVQSDPTDFVELVNIGSASVDISGYKFKDDTDAHDFQVIPSGTVMAPGAHLSIASAVNGLGKGDAVRLYLPDGTTLLDSTTWPANTHATTWGRCPDGTGTFGAMTGTLGATNACATPNTAVKINEFSSNNPDFVELINTGNGPVSLAGWVLKDNTDNNSYTFPAGSTIAAGQIKALSGEGVDFVFGLGGGDSVRLFDNTGATIDSYDYPAHPPAGKSYGRCPDGTGAFVITAASTKGAVNSCPAPAGADKLKINEVQSDPGDLIELVNNGDSALDVSGYRLKDNDDTHLYTIAAGTSIGAHAYKTFDVSAAFGLGKGDSARLYTPDGAILLDSTTWPTDTHAADWGRCPDGTGDFGTMANTLGATNVCGTTGPPDVKINEVESNGDQVADWVELKNNSASPVDISGWKLLDNDPAHIPTPVVVPAGTVIAAGGYYAIYTEINQTPGFGLGGADSATLYLPDGTTQVDTYSWTAHAATTYGRCPDGTGAFTTTTTPTRGLANACSPIRINEVESNGDPVGDWVELKNISGGDVNIGGWVFKDNDDTDNYTIPAGTVVPAGGYKVLDVAQFVFGLGAADSARLFDNTAKLIDSYSWTAHATQTYGRCKDGLGDFADTKAPTKGAANSCPGLDTQPWPGGQTVSYADNTDTFVQDLSGLVFDPSDPDVLWAAQNKKGTLFKLVRDANNNWVPAPEWPRDPKFANGQGSPDTEGITIGGDGFVYLTTERDNDASGVSRNTILRIDPNAPAGATITPTTEWNLTPLLPSVGANLGLEGVTYVPDSYLTSNHFKDQSTGLAYSPADYPLHGKGLFFVAYENNGKVYGFALDSNGVAHLVATIDSGFAALADIDYDPELQRIRAVTDDTFDGKTSLLKIDASGNFVVDTAYDRPLGMPNLNNEGLAVAPQSRCVNGTKEVLWSDDGDTDGHSIRRGTINCTPPAPQNVSFSTPVPQGIVVGDTYTPIATGGGSGNPVVLSIDALSLGVCSITGNLVHFDHAGSCVIRASQAAGQGYQAGSTTQTVPVGKAGQAISFTQPGDTVFGGASVPLVATSNAALPVTFTSTTPSVCSTDGATAVPVTAGTCTITATQDGDDDHTAAAPVSRSLTVAKATQSITFAQPGDTTFGGANVPLTVGASSGLAVTLTSTTPGVCTISGTSAVPVAAGTCSITATQAGDGNYGAADPVSRSLTVAKAAQSLTFAQPADTVYGGADVALTGSASSGLPVAFTSTTPAVCTVAGTSVTPVAAGTCSITASQAGNGNYLAAAPVTRTLTVAKAPVVVTTKSTSGLVSLLTLKITYTTTVKSAVTGLPVAGVPVTTRINGGYATSGCTATTNASGVATCTVGPVSIALGVTYTASAAEGPNTLSGSGSAFIGLL